MKKLYFAPLEGITSHIFRNIHRTMTNDVDAYYAPFIHAKQTHVLQTRELKDNAPENNQNLSLVPQILSNNIDDFNWTAQTLLNLGYKTVNLNLGCPMPTVVTRRKGSAMLADLDSLRQFLDGIFAPASRPAISIKSRLGFKTLDIAESLIDLFNDYPIELLIIHPRCQRELYSGRAHLDLFMSCLKRSKHDVCYNGDIFSRNDYEKLVQSCHDIPQLKAVMIGRGAVANPMIFREIRGGKQAALHELQHYHDALFNEFLNHYQDCNTVLHKMKEIWFYLGTMFQGCDKTVHKIRISKTVEELRSFTDMIWKNAVLSGQFHAL